MFGILANRWRVFHTTMHLSPERVTSVTLSALILHNYLLKSPSKSTYRTPVLIDQKDEQGNVIAGSWRSEHMAEEFTSIAPQSQRRPVTSQCDKY